MSKTINILGAGLAGSIMATLLRAEGRDVRVIDDDDKFSASQASSNLFVADWYTKEGERAKIGFDVLERLYGKVTEKPFAAGIKIAPKMLHIPQRHVLVKPDVVGTATYADDQGLTLGDMRHFSGPMIICGGYRHNGINTPVKLDMEVYAGHRFLFKGDLAQGRLDMVAPYKHGKLYQLHPGEIYYADSVKIKLDQYNKRQGELKDRTLERAKAAIGYLPEIIDFRVGYRPMVKDRPFGISGGMPGQHGFPAWYMNGGGKNGCVAYAYHANEILKAIKAAGL